MIRVIIITILIITALAYTETEYPRVMDNGGGTSTNSSYRNQASIGQAVIGLSLSTGYQNQAGYITGVSISVGIKESPTEQLPRKISVLPPHPNPFNCNAWIEVLLPQDSDISFRMFNLNGIEVFQKEEHLKAGVSRLGIGITNLPSGIYFYQIGIQRNIYQGKLVLVK